ncbi:hypothetical protein [Burkholderia glumae]|uniref:hypothetical protein n=1 Tax=Burkholderia glumae TaxID=337 RepID=UPI00214FCA74|nr:hypothetical protein [Burkholderia glumae]
MSLRPSLRRYGAHLNRQQRRAWMVQRLTRSPRVPISSGFVPRGIARVYTYCKVA